MIPISLYISLLLYRIRKFVATFKPRVIDLILDFISKDDFEYKSNHSLSKQDFLKSKIFATDAPYYKGEDYIKGKIGEIDFEMCELMVREYSKVRSRLNYVFKGVFLRANFDDKFQGEVYILPSEFSQYLTRSIKGFTKEGAYQYEFEGEPFNDAFLVFSNKENLVFRLLSPEVRQMLVHYRNKSGKEIYISFLDGKIHIAITEPKDILEPYLFQSNVSFELVREFYEDLQMLLTIVEDFDRHH